MVARYSIDELLQARRKYIAENGLMPFSPSDWHVENNELLFPEKLVRKAYEKAHENKNEYSFSAYLPDVERVISKGLQDRGISTSIDCTLFQSATSALAANIENLKHNGFKRALVVTPNYFSTIDVLNEIGFSVSYFHINAQHSSDDITSRIIQSIQEQYIDTLFFTEPIFCLGELLSEEAFQRIVECINSNQACLFLDHALGGFEHSNMPYDPMPSTYLKKLSNCESYVIVDSPTKRLLLNGVKIGLSYSFGLKKERQSQFLETRIGALNADQVALTLFLIEGAFQDELDSCRQNNLRVISDNKDCIRSLFLGSEDWRYKPTNSGWFDMIWAQSKKKQSSFEIAKMILDHSGVFIIPSEHFSFYEGNGFGFRVNLLKNNKDIISSLNKVITVQV